MSLSTRLARLPRRLRRPATLLVVGVAALGVAAAACTPDPPPPAPGEVCDAPAGSTPSAVAVMGRCPRLSVEQMAVWFEANTKSTYRASVPLRTLIGYYVEEGNAEGVRGDLAFAQAILETGWFSSQLTATHNNYAGIGAIDSNPMGNAAVFPDARTGVRAQIQHLRAYADKTATTCTAPPLRHACVDPRFHLVSPKGKAPTWNQFGNGVWATDPGYAGKVLDLYRRMLERYGLSLA